MKLVKWLFVVLMFCVPSLAYGDPSIEFVRTTHDFGHVIQGEELEYAFEFTNTGTDELVIEGLKSS